MVEQNQQTSLHGRVDVSQLFRDLLFFLEDRIDAELCDVILEELFI